MSATYSTKLTANTSQHDQAINQSAQQIYKYKKSAEQTDKSMSGLVGKVGKFVKVLAVANVASEGFNSIMRNNQSVADNYGQTMEVCKRISDEFFYSISKADFSTMINGLGSCITAAKEYYNALDNLQTLQLGLIGENARLDEQMQAARLRVRQGDASAVADIERISTEMLANVTAERQKIQTTLDKMVKKFVSGASGKSGDYTATYDRGFDIEQVQRWVSHQNELSLAIAKAKGEMDRLKKSASEYNDMNGIHYQAAAAEAYYKALVKLQDKMSDGDNLNEFEQQYSRMYQLQSQYSQMQQRNLRYTKELGADVTKPTKTTPTTPKVQVETEVLPPPEGSIAELEAKLSDLKAQYKLAISDESRAELRTQIEQTQAELDRMNGKVIEMPVTIPENSIAGIQAKIAALQKIYNETDSGEIRLQVTAEISGLQAQLKELTTTDADKKLEALQDRMKQMQQEGEATASVFSMLGGSFNAFANFMDEDSAKVVNAFGDIIEQIGQLIPKIIALIGAEEGEALATGTASAAKIGFPQNIAAMAAVFAQVMSIVGTIGSLVSASKYADGGIVGGSTTVGDMQLARLNSGEMVLNQTQQSRLFKMLNSGSVFANTEPLPQTIQLVAHGGDLVGTISNYNRKVSRVK